jgi:hypothetical protein
VNRVCEVAYSSSDLRAQSAEKGTQMKVTKSMVPPKEQHKGEENEREKSTRTASKESTNKREKSTL